MHAMVICDQAEELALLSYILRRASVMVTTATELEEGMRQFVAHPTDIIVLALRKGTPRGQALRVRRDSEAPLAIIAAPLHEDDTCDLLDGGVDLLVSRPYSARIVQSQLRALLRRAQGTPLNILPTFTLGGLSLDPSTRMVHVDGHTPRRLTQLEFRLLYVLMMHQGQTLPTETIVERVWGYDSGADTELVRGLVRRLRAKIEPIPQHPRYIITEPAIGYLFHVPEP